MFKDNNSNHLYYVLNIMLSHCFSKSTSWPFLGHASSVMKHFLNERRKESIISIKYCFVKLLVPSCPLKLHKITTWQLHMKISTYYFTYYLIFHICSSTYYFINIIQYIKLQIYLNKYFFDFYFKIQNNLKQILLRNMQYLYKETLMWR